MSGPQPAPALSIGGLTRPIDFNPIFIPNLQELPIVKALKVIEDKAATLSWKGTKKRDVNAQGSGFSTEYENATVWATKDANGNWHAAEVHGDIRAYHNSIGGGRSVVGCPITDETVTPDSRGRFNSFQKGAIYWTPEFKAHEILGDILKQWRDLGSERSWLGYPVTGEIAYPRGRLTSFEHGQIHWENGATSTIDFKGAITQKYNGIGGIRSRLGLPLDKNMGFGRSGNSMLMSFRGGTITYPLDQPAPSAMSAQSLQIIWTGLECQVKMESNDELSGAISLLVPSTVNPPFIQKFGDQGAWQLGQKHERIMNTNAVLYQGPPADVIITTELVELDASAGNPLAVVNKIADVLKGGADALKTVGGVTGEDVLSGYGREIGGVIETFKDIQSSTVFKEIVKVFQSPDDPYPAGIIHLRWADMVQRSTPKKVLRRDDDAHTITWTESVTVNATDDGGDKGQYCFYFNVNVTNNQTPL